jgi:hypothetical protein
MRWYDIDISFGLEDHPDMELSDRKPTLRGQDPDRVAQGGQDFDR